MGNSGLSVLSRLKPEYGLILDTSAGPTGLIDAPAGIETVSGNIDEIDTDVRFDYVVMDIFLPYIEDMYHAMKKIRHLCHEESKLIITNIQMPAFRRGLPELFLRKGRREKNWLPRPMIETLIYEADFDLCSINSNFMVAEAVNHRERVEFSYSIMIPCFNEEGNIEDCIRRIPDLKRDYEIIVVNDGSSDLTAEVVRELAKTNHRLHLIDNSQNRGKGYATWCGLQAATKDVLIILDADMTVKPEDLPLFMYPLELRQANFVNGTRMVYPMENDAMNLVHRFGNKLFSIIFSYLLNQQITDTLCGTKCLFREDFNRIIVNDHAWPDFDMLFGVSQLNLKLVEIPIHYQSRHAGESKMKTLRHGFLLLKSAFRGFLKLKLNIGAKVI
jgi:hypothetical protein